MNRKISLILIFSSILVFSCSSCKTDESKVETKNNIHSKISNEDLFVDGQITVIGNEPFTKLGLLVNDSTIYQLECEKEIKDTLLKNQGNFYKIFFKEKVETKTGIILSVTKTEKILK